MPTRRGDAAGMRVRRTKQVPGAEAPRPPGVFFDVEEAPMPTQPIDPDHHLWKNGRLFWVAFTVHLPGWRKERVRRSLKTEDVVEARKRRDDLFARLAREEELTLSLRFVPASRVA